MARSQALATVDSASAIRNSISLWAEQNTRPETGDRAAKLKDKISIVTAFFDFTAKHPGDVTPEDVATWREQTSVSIGSFFFTPLDLSPGIPQADCPVEYQLPRHRSGIHAEVTHAFELIPRTGHRVAQARLNLTAG